MRRKLVEKCKEMNDILKEYDPEADYLSVAIYPKDGYIGITNNYWEEHPMISCAIFEESSDV